MIRAPESLVEGQRLDQPAFHSLYEAMPPGTRAELIDGVVYMPSPVGAEHSDAHSSINTWLGYYRWSTPGVKDHINPSLVLGRRSEPQPDLVMRIVQECGGRSSVVGGYVHGPPELVVEVSRTTRYIDLGPKLNDYERAGVLEYLVRTFDPDEIVWYALENGTLARLPIGEDGVYRSRVFPGLWLDANALLADDAQRLREVLDMGCALPEHATFVERLAAKR